MLNLINDPAAGVPLAVWNQAPGSLFIKLPGERFMSFSSYEQSPEGVYDIHFYNVDGEEIVMWESTEWQESPVEVMGAILGAMRGSGRYEPC